MNFRPDRTLSNLSGNELCFAFYQDRLLINISGNAVTIPCLSALHSSGLNPIREQFIGWIGQCPCIAAELADAECPQGMAFTGLRQLFEAVDEELFWAAGRAFQIVNWERTHLFCSRCGTLTRDKTDELAKECTACGYISYPVMSPAIIVAVVRDSKLLLARNQSRPFKFYSVLAGFVEAGESLEACVQREVMEEVGIAVKNIAYFGSQPWPFPNSLMIAFTAEYADGEIQVDGKEIAEADWFSASHLPEIPGKISIAWQLIQWFKNKYQ